MLKNLGADAEDFLAALREKPKRAARINTLKADAAAVAAALGLDKRTDYCKDAFLIDDESINGAHPYHCAGLLYFQEPSAMLAVEAARPHLQALFSASEFPTVLDMCAAPGGKSGQLAALLQGRGVMVCNETVFKRTAPLLSNLERLGVRNAMVTSSSADEFARLLGGAFDACFVDTPCSGEGMLRKEASAWENMNEKTMLACAARQAEIFCAAKACVKEGGLLVYSTCTLNRTENENILLDAVQSGEFEPLACPHLQNVRQSDVFTAYRAFPQDGGGEGHFVCVLKKRASSPRPPRFSSPFSGAFRDEKKLRDALQPLCAPPLFYTPFLFRDGVYLSPPLPFVKGLSVVRAGVKAAQISGSRLIPDHAYALSLRREETVNRLSFPCAPYDENGHASDAAAAAEGAAALAAYLRGEQLSVPSPFQGYGAVCADGYPLGLVKAGGDGVKNRYPKGLRLLQR